MGDFKSGDKIYTIYQAMNGYVLERGWDGGEDRGADHDRRRVVAEHE